MKTWLIAAPLLVLLAGSLRLDARLPSTQPSQPQQRVTIEYSGPVRLNPYAQPEARSTDPGARAATWRYYYSSPAFYYGYPYCGWYGGYYRYGYRIGRPFGIGIGFSGWGSLPI
jgi:hypothetical protein